VVSQHYVCLASKSFNGRRTSISFIEIVQILKSQTEMIISQKQNPNKKVNNNNNNKTLAHSHSQTLFFGFVCWESSLSDLGAVQDSPGIERVSRAYDRHSTKSERGQSF
jgi:hypothetical protein